MAEGREKERGGNPEEEIGKYRAILDKDPMSRVFAPLAEAYRKAGLLDDAIATAREGLGHHPSYLSGRVALARALFEKGEPAEARSEISQVVQAAPDNLMAHKLLGQIHLESGNAAEAEKSFNMVLLLDPRDQEAQTALDNLKTPPAHTPPPIETGPPAAEAEPEAPWEVPGAPREEFPAESEENGEVPEGLELEEEDESTPFDQSFDDVIEMPSAGEMPAADIDDAFEQEEGGDAGEAVPDAGGEGAPDDLGPEDLEGPDPAWETAGDEAVPVEPAGEAAEAAGGSVIADAGSGDGNDDMPFDLGGEEDLDAVETAVESEEAPFDLGADDEWEDDEPVAGTDAVPFEPEAGEDRAAVEPAAAVTMDEAAVEADDVAFDLGVDAELEEGGDSGGAPAMEIEELPVDLAEEDLELPAGAVFTGEGETVPEFEDLPSPGDEDIFSGTADEDAVPAGIADGPALVPEEGAGETIEFESPAGTAPEPAGEEEPPVETGPVAEGDAFNTETLAQLYIKQGFYDKAAGVYEAMLEEAPDDLSLRQRLEEARSLAGMMAQAKTPAVAEEELPAPQPPAAESTIAAERGEHPAIVGLRRFLEQLKERQR